MKAWMTSIIGVICLGVLLEIVMPEGKTAKYVRGAFSLIVIFVIISPLPAFLKRDMTAEFSLPVYVEDAAFKSETYAAYADGLSEQLESWLESEGYPAKVRVELKENSADIGKVRVWLISGFDEVGELLSKRLHIGRESIILLNGA